jgi:uncharacterized protein (DUF1800 family)
MDRRQFLSLKKNNLNDGDVKPKVERRTNTGLAKYNGTWTKAEAAHLLRRTLYGPKVSEINAFASKTVSQAVDALLDTSGYSFLPPVNNYQNQTPDTAVAYGSTWVNAPLNVNLEGSRKVSLKSWLWSLPARQKTTIMEKMIVFWHNHMPVQIQDIPLASLAYFYVKVLNDYALGNFKTLVKQITVDPAMLYYLNGRLNTKNAPDENYARELQELFTLGKGPNSKYTEDDVKAAARVLTGFNINFTTTPFSTGFSAVNHDSTNKTFSSFYGNKTISGKTGVTAGSLELDDLLGMIFSVEEVSKHICRKLYRYFVYYEIDANSEANVIEPLAKIFRDNNYEIKPVLKALLESEHFYDQWNRACVIKDPLTHQAGLVRQWEMSFPTATDYETNYQIYAVGSYFGQITQMNLGDPPSVSGWEAWYQMPLYHRIWLNSDSLPKRNQFQDYLMWVGHKVKSFTFIVDPWVVTKQFSDPKNVNTLILEACDFLLPLQLSSAQIGALKEILLPGGIPDYNWSDEYRAATDSGDPNHTTALSTATSKLRSLYKNIMNLSEYQLS